MMSNYALVQDNKVINTDVWDGEKTVNVGKEFSVVFISGDAPVSIEYEYDGKVFSAASLTEEQQAAQDSAAISSNTIIKTTLMNEASQRINVLQDAVNLDMATDDEIKLLPLGKKYRVLLSRINTEITGAVRWPEKPGY